MVIRAVRAASHRARYRHCRKAPDSGPWCGPQEHNHSCGRGQAFVSQHIGDLDHYESLKSFRATNQALASMYEVDWRDLLLVHDSILNTSRRSCPGTPSRHKRSIQHHRAHIASVLAERQAWDKRIVGISFDGTGYGETGQSGAANYSSGA